MPLGPTGVTGRRVRSAVEPGSDPGRRVASGEVPAIVGPSVPGVAVRDVEAGGVAGRSVGGTAAVPHAAQRPSSRNLAPPQAGQVNKPAFLTVVLEPGTL